MTHQLLTMHTIAPSIPNVVACRQPLASILATDTRHIRPADNFVDLLTIRFAQDVPVARSPVLGRDRIPIAGQTKRVKAVHKTNYENRSFVFVRPTPNRPPLRVIEEENAKHSAGAKKAWRW